MMQRASANNLQTQKSYETANNQSMLFANQDMNERGSHINVQRDSVFFNGSMRGSHHKEVENMNE